jgi:hypothetical protein
MKKDNRYNGFWEINFLDTYSNEILMKCFEVKLINHLQITKLHLNQLYNFRVSHPLNTGIRITPAPLETELVYLKTQKTR